MDTAQEIKKRLDITDFIREYLQLKKVGINYSAPCPFHEEKTPSFMVSPERQSFRCFGCGESGDVISFYQKIEGLSFPEALKLLGERTGVEVRFKSKEATAKERTVRDKIFRVNLLAAKYFKMMLRKKEGRLALDYLHGRKLSDQTIENFKVGFAPSDTKLRVIFSKMKVSESDLALAGHPERFRHRIIFPIFDTLGNIVGFSGRIMEAGLPQGVSPHPKYLNTPETPVFHKSRILYGINFAKQAIRQKKRAILVEGQMDVLLSHDAGVKEVVASSGTALTDEHLKILRRYGRDVIFAFDEDEAGQKAALSATQMALRQGLEVKLTIIKKYKDIGELVEHDRNLLPAIFDDALSPVEYLVARAGAKLDAKGKKELVNQALLFVSAMLDEVEKSHYIGYLAKVVAVPEVTIEKALLKIKEKPSSQKQNEQPLELDWEIEFMAFLINFPQIVNGLTLDEGIEFATKEYEGIYTKVRKCYADLSSAKNKLLKVKKDLSRELLEKIDASALRWDQKIAEEKDEAFQEFISIKARLASRGREKVKQDFAQMIAQAESSGNIKKVRHLMNQLQKELK